MDYSIKNTTHGSGYFSPYWQPIASLVHADVVTTIPTVYNELLPSNYSDITITGNEDLVLNFAIDLPKTWSFYIMLKNHFQQFVIPNTYVFEVASCGASSAVVTSVPDT